MGGRSQPALGVRRRRLEVAAAAELGDELGDGVQGGDAEVAADLLERRREAVALAERRDEVVGGALARGKQAAILPIVAASGWVPRGRVAPCGRPLGDPAPPGGTLGAPHGTVE